MKPMKPLSLSTIAWQFIRNGTTWGVLEKIENKYRVSQKIWHHYVVRLNFTKYQPIFKIISLPESGENM